MDMHAFDVVRQLAASQYLVRALHVITELGVADEIGEAPEELPAISTRLDVQEDALTRLLRLLSSRGIFHLAGNNVGHTEASRFLRADHPGSLRDFVRMFAQPIQWQTASELMHSVKTGEAAADRVFPEGGLWGYFAAHADEARVFDAAMEAKSSAQIGDLLKAHDFSRYSRVADIGGGRGHLLRAILNVNSSATGILFDLPPVIEAARTPLQDRLEFIGGDFFADPIPSGDAIILMEVLHDWDDSHCARILQAVRRAAKPDTRLLVIEIEMRETNNPDWPKLLDIVMLGLFAARQRTNAEYAMLLQANGFSVREQRSTPGEMTIIEAAAS